MSFFSSDIVQEEMREISDLQQRIFENMFTFFTMNKEEKIEHIEILEQLINKQRVLYTRLSLSDDPEAKKMHQRILDSATEMGYPKKTDLCQILQSMEKQLSSLKKMMESGVD